MNQTSGDLWHVVADYRVITTNGFIKTDGSAVMGRGAALQAKNAYPGVESALGDSLRIHGNHVAMLPHHLISFPVKRNWWEKAELELIERSLAELKSLAERLDPQTVAMPMPGTGNGQLTFEEVMPLVTEIELGNNVCLVHLRLQ